MYNTVTKFSQFVQNKHLITWQEKQRKLGLSLMRIRRYAFLLYETSKYLTDVNKVRVRFCAGCATILGSRRK